MTRLQLSRNDLSRFFGKGFLPLFFLTA